MKKIIMIIMALAINSVVITNVVAETDTTGDSEHSDTTGDSEHSDTEEMTTEEIQAALENSSEAEVLQQMIDSGMSVTDAVSAMVAAVPSKKDAIIASAVALAADQEAAIITAANEASDPVGDLGATSSGDQAGGEKKKDSGLTPGTSVGGGGTGTSP